MVDIDENVKEFLNNLTFKYSGSGPVFFLSLQYNFDMLHNKKFVTKCLLFFLCRVKYAKTAMLARCKFPQYQIPKCWLCDLFPNLIVIL